MVSGEELLLANDNTDLSGDLQGWGTKNRKWHGGGAIGYQEKTPALKVIEVKAKSYDAQKPFLNVGGRIRSGVPPYLKDVAISSTCPLRCHPPV